MDDDDETTDSRTEQIKESMQLRKLAKLASEFNKTVKGEKPEPSVCISTG
jgi:hypothetical protein